MTVFPVVRCFDFGVVATAEGERGGRGVGGSVGAAKAFPGLTTLVCSRRSQRTHGWRAPHRACAFRFF